MKQKLYFRNEDSKTCHPLEYHLEEAKTDGLEDFELFEAIPDNDNKEFVWCSWAGDVAERSECGKAGCDMYSSKSGRGVCEHRGKLYTHGNAIKVKVK